jgi:ATP-dependent DNA helicase DinG
VPEIPSVPGVVAPRGLANQVAEVFAPGGPLARRLSDFEPRGGQIEMAKAVADVFESGGIVLAEAGTGTGKTLAYLVPAILSRERVLISTGTKNLQEQIFSKDLPALREALRVSFTATYMKGRANYLCLHRLDQLDGGNERDGVGERQPFRRLDNEVFVSIVRKWSTRTDTGDRAELDLPEDLPLWNEISATTETCLGTECPRYDECFVTRMRQRAAASDVVIVNHHLLCADASVRQNAFGEVIPACHHLVIDEAHQLEDVATQYFGFNVSTYRVEELARDVEHLAAGPSGHDDRGSERRLDISAQRDLTHAIKHVRDHARTFFAALASAPRDGRFRDRPSMREERVRVTEASLADAHEPAADLIGALDGVEATLALLKPPRQTDVSPDDGTEEDVASLRRRAATLRDELRFLIRAGDPEYVYFVEFRGRGTFLRAAPIDVSAIVKEHLLDRMRATVLTSATLTVDGRFDYIRDRLGIARAGEVRLPSEFDFRRQAILYLPPRMPDPRSLEFAGAAGREVVEILKRSRGRAFVLFTSFAMMRGVQGIAEMALDYPIFVQGTAPRSQLLKQFRETPHSVLFATSSFWQGVDVVGDALSCVIIDKLPFASPADPITSARIDAIRARGGEPFEEYQVPLAILTLQQGLGRLIRHRRDRGVLAVLDPRLRTKAYGRRFLASLPAAPAVHDLACIEAFFEE